MRTAAASAGQGRKSELQGGKWCRDMVPGTELRRWYGHRPERFGEFVGRYREELMAGGAGGAVPPLAS
jgi:uncharacterized protein YeaO (DUF488 family)